MWVKFAGTFGGDFDGFKEAIAQIFASMIINYDFDDECMSPTDSSGVISFPISARREEQLGFRLFWSKWRDDCFIVSIEWDAPEDVEQLLSDRATTLASYFDDVVLLSAEGGLQSSLNAYQSIHCLESSIRQAIVWALMRKYGPHWWEEGVAAISIRGRYPTLGEKARSLAERDQTVVHDRCSHHLLFYLDFSDLRVVVDSDPEVFAFLLDEDEGVDFRQHISLLRKLRNRLMHGRYLTEENQAAILMVSRQYARLLENLVDEDTRRRLGSSRRR